jgi:hypothetical protein
LNNIIGSTLLFADLFGLPYQTDNRIVIGVDFNNEITLCFGNHIVNDSIFNKYVLNVFNLIYFEDANNCYQVSNNDNVELEILKNKVVKISNNSCSGVIDSNTAKSISGNVSSFVGASIHEMTSSEIEDNTDFEYIEESNVQFVLGLENVSFRKCTGTELSNVTTTEAHRYLEFCTFGFLNNVVIVDRDINDHNFISTINGRTLTPTATMEAISTTTSKYDVGLTQHVEEILTSGAITYSSAITA